MSAEGGFTRGDRHAILGFLLAGLVGLLLYIHLYDSAFPTASLNLKVTQSDARRIGEEFLKSQGHNLSGYRSVVTFNDDSGTRSFLERNLGLRRANRLMADKVQVWHWHVRWFKPMLEEEFSACISPDGKVIGLHHTIPEEERGKNLPRAQALEIASQFTSSVGIDLRKYKLVNESSDKLPNRMDHDFTWEERDWKVAEATHRTRISVSGNRISSFSHHLKIPEKWREKVSKESGDRGLLMNIAGVGSYVIGLAIFVIFLLAVRARDIRWRFALILAGALALAQLVESINSLPVFMAYYDTTESMGSFIGSNVFSMVLGVLGVVFGVLFLGSSADAMHRWAHAGGVAVSRLISREGVRSKSFVRACLIGLGLGLAHLGYVSSFYVVAMKYFGAWSPADVPYNNTLNTALPWIYPLTIGLSAAITEEFTFRLFAVSFVKKYLRLTWLALLIPAVIWAFLHSNYPQQPPYVRGIELTVVGIALGIVYLKYGVIATLVSHYTYNAVVGGTLLVKSDNLYFRLSGLAVMGLMLLPLLPAAMRALRRPSVEEESFAEPPPPAPVPSPAPAPETEGVYEPLSPRKRRIMLWAALGGVAALIALGILEGKTDLYEPGDKVINRSRALRTAEEHMR